MTRGESQVRVLGDSGQARMTPKGFLTIHQFATLCRTTVRTIRFYDKEGILKPASVDSYTEYRYYHPHQTREFFKIKLIQTFDVPLKEIEKVGKMYSEGSFLDKKLAEIKAEIEEKKRQYNVLQIIK